MGYYTQYKLEIAVPKNVDYYALERKIATYALSEWAYWATDLGFYEETVKKYIVDSDGTKVKTLTTYGAFHSQVSDGMKWYDHDKDMRIISTKFPDVVFILKGEGEESGDLWIKYYKNGKMQGSTAKVVYEEFDESKLQ